jgi:hypothetical protein
MLSHIAEFIEEFGSLVFINSSTFESNHVFDVKALQGRTNQATCVPTQLMHMAKRYRALHTMAVLNARRSSQGGRTASSVGLPSTAGTRTSSNGSSSATSASVDVSDDDDADDEGDDFDEVHARTQFKHRNERAKFQPKRGLSAALYMERHPIQPSNADFLHGLAYHVSEYLNL